MSNVEYRVRPVTRYVVTRHIDTGFTGSSAVVGEFPNEEAAQGLCMVLSHFDKEAKSPIEYPTVLGGTFSGLCMHPRGPDGPTDNTPLGNVRGGSA